MFRTEAAVTAQRLPVASWSADELMEWLLEERKLPPDLAASFRLTDGQMVLQVLKNTL